MSALIPERILLAMSEPYEPLPKKVGIYFLFWKGKIVYVGQSVDVEYRLMTHRREGRKQFDAYAWTPCNQDELTELEEKYIFHIKPKYNKTLWQPPTPVKRSTALRYLFRNGAPYKEAKKFVNSLMGPKELARFTDIWAAWEENCNEHTADD